MRQDSLYEIQQKVSMSQRIVKKDKDWREYAGGNLIINDKIAKLMTLNKAGLIPTKLKPLVSLALIYLEQQRKAHFGAMSTELTKLGFILGDPRNKLRATKKRD